MSKTFSNRGKLLNQALQESQLWAFFSETSRIQLCRKINCTKCISQDEIAKVWCLLLPFKFNLCFKGKLSILAMKYCTYPPKIFIFHSSSLIRVGNHGNTSLRCVLWMPPSLLPSPPWRVEFIDCCDTNTLLNHPLKARPPSSHSEPPITQLSFFNYGL